MFKPWGSSPCQKLFHWSSFYTLDTEAWLDLTWIGLKLMIELPSLGIGDSLAGLTNVVAVDTVEDLGGRRHLIQTNLQQRKTNSFSTTICSHGLGWLSKWPSHFTKEWLNGFSASWESSICERKLHYPGNRTQDTTPIRGDPATIIVYCWVKKFYVWPFATISK